MATLNLNDFQYYKQLSSDIYSRMCNEYNDEVNKQDEDMTDQELWTMAEILRERMLDYFENEILPFLNDDEDDDIRFFEQQIEEIKYMFTRI